MGIFMLYFCLKSAAFGLHQYHPSILINCYTILGKYNNMQIAVFPIALRRYGMHVNKLH